jgi:UDP-N-acetylglucosamine 4,6-dehydratase
MSIFDGKNVLVTGATGSFGKRFLQRILEDHKPKRVVAISRDELKQFEMQQWLSDPRLTYILGDVRDKDRVYRSMDGIDVVVHAAAMKQVPASENNPMEAIRTNVMGAENIINACIDQGVDRVIALSTDKAANPANLYGATKLCSDKLFVAANGLSKRHRTKFSVVRYGNVLGSRGSVVPFFLEKKVGGVIPITDPRMTRFWITLRQGVDFVCSSLEMMNGGEIFIPKIPSMNIMAVAEAVVPECATEVIGIRAGEKLHEIMITEDDAINVVEFDDRYVIQPQSDWWDQEEYKNSTGSKSVEEFFQYRSDLNEEWMAIDQLQKLLAEEGIKI